MTVLLQTPQLNKTLETLNNYLSPLHAVNDSAGGEVRNVAITFVGVVTILATVVGNILVVAAVCTEPRLRKVSNSYIVSLAVADLLVGLLVCPIMLIYHLSGEWTMGEAMCDFLVSVDVVCCTASILNLCVISIDRYFAITRPLRYVYQRTPVKATIMVACCWLFSLVIAFPPLVGWREPREGDIKQCVISQDKGYTVFSTIGAFYLPLAVMLTVYVKVYQATVQRQKHWVPGPGSSRACVGALCTSTRSLYNSILTAGNDNEEENISGKGKRLSEPWLRRTEAQRPLASRPSQIAFEPVSHTTLNTSKFLRIQEDRSSSSSQPENCNDNLNVICPKDAILDSCSEGHTSSDSINNNNQHTQESGTDRSVRRIQPPLLRTGSRQAPNHRKRGRKNRRPALEKRISVAQERRAAKTLGIIMGCFVFCWLPFFLLALLMPLCATCRVPSILVTSFTWLGYANSAVNPVVYTCFNEDFRKAFKRILLPGRCFTPHLKLCLNCAPNRLKTDAV